MKNKINETKNTHTELYKCTHASQWTYEDKRWVYEDKYRIFVE
ncbi:hypothetical protein [Prevotella pallens]|nr:hypothetical protein [Prevotella pallens]